MKYQCNAAAEQEQQAARTLWSNASQSGRQAKGEVDTNIYGDYGPQQQALAQHQSPAAAAAPIIRSDARLSVRDPLLGNFSDPGGGSWNGSGRQYGGAGGGTWGTGRTTSTERGSGDLLPQGELDALMARNAARMAALNRALAAAAVPPGADAAAAAAAAAAGEAVLERYLRRQPHQLLV